MNDLDSYLKHHFLGSPDPSLQCHLDCLSRSSKIHEHSNGQNDR